MKLVSILFSLITIYHLQAQQIDMSIFKGMTPRSIGPSGMSGRVTAIDVVNHQPNIIYAGTASGGLWKSKSGGIDWEPVFDEQEVSSIGSIAIQQNNPDVIWVGTGEGNPRNSLNGGYGIYKSLDAGKTWKLMGLEKTRHIHRIIIHRDNPDIVYIAAIGSPWGYHSERGIYRTKDGGKSWEKILYVDEKTGAADLVVDPTNPNKLLAAMWEHRRWPWTFNSGGPGSGLYITFDGGDNWEERTSEDGLPKGELGRIGLAIAPSKPSIIYALVESKKNALYKSEDGGFKWKKVNDKSEIGNRPFYYSDIFVDPKNENRIYSLFSLVNVSEDGGRSFEPLLPFIWTGGVHPDHHAWWIHPENPKFMIDGNDGGLNITYDQGKSWRFVENLPVAQFYHINIDNDIPYNVYGGMQDNGSWAGPAYVWDADGIRNAYWQEVSFGDGFDVVPDPDNSRYGYSMSQQGNLVRYDRLTGHTKFSKPTHPDPDVQLRFNWNAGIAQDPHDNSTIYYGSQFLHKSTNKGDTWEIISPDLTTNDTTKQKQHESGGLTIDATGAENYTTILTIAPSPVQEGIIWVGTDDGNVQLTRDGGNSWTNLSPRMNGMPSGAWIAQIRASTYNAGEAFVVVNNYRNFDYEPYLLHTSDFGQTWRNLVSEDNVWGYALAVVQDPVEPRLLFLGSEFGLYVSFDAGSTWNKWTEEYPSVSTMDLALQARESDLVIGTFGRAAFVLDDIQALREIARQGAGLLSKKLHLFPTDIAYHTISQQPPGTRFSANAMFQGENRDKGAIFTYLINKPEEIKNDQKDENSKKGKKADENDNQDEKEEKVKYDSLVIQVYDSNDTLIRTIKREAPEENGIHRFTWNLNEKGVRWPRREKPRTNAPEPSGVDVLPGTYKVKFTFGDQADSTNVQVAFDPRVNVPGTTLEALYDAKKEVQRGVALASKAMIRLLDSKDIVDEYIKKMKDKDQEEYKELIDESKAVKDSINTLIDSILGKEDDRQGIVRSPDPTPMTYHNRAFRYLNSRLELPGETERRLMEQARNKISPVIEQINQFFNTQWQDYREKVIDLDLSSFKDYEPLKFDE